MVNQKFYQLGTAPSVIRELFAYGLEQAKTVGPENVFDYSLGNPSIPAPAKVNQSIHDILNDTDSIKVHGYSMACGFDSAREAIAANLNRRFGTDLKAGNLFLTCGAAPGLIAVIKALLAEEDSEIMVVAPFFPEYRPFTESNGGHLVVVPADTDAFQIDLDQVERRLTPRTQAIIINSPNNPSGVVYTRRTLEGLARLLERKSAEYGHPIYMIADEPYRELVYGGVEVPFIPTVYRSTIVCYSYSKSLSLPGERIGYICVPDSVEDHQAVYSAIAGAVGSLKGPLHGGANAKVMEQFRTVKANVNPKDDASIKDFLYKILNKEAGDKSGKIYGLGHAVYTISDPRAVLLKKYARHMAEIKGYDEDFQLLEKIEELGIPMIQNKTGSDMPMCANVDMYSGLVYTMLGIPEDVFTPLFASARIAGWCANRIEEVLTCHRIMRPAYRAMVKRVHYEPMSARPEHYAHTNP